ncbi:MAG: hypothetical protein EXS31_14630 [Pedosphaera sp.]|nr:hypothetical protein [Pedosphaera sp.]
MSRIAGVNPQQAAPPVSDVFLRQKQTWGAFLKPYLLYARRPSILLSVRAMWDALGESGLLPKTLTSLVCRRVASINGCLF